MSFLLVLKRDLKLNSCLRCTPLPRHTQISLTCLSIKKKSLFDMAVHVHPATLQHKSKYVYSYMHARVQIDQPD